MKTTVSIYDFRREFQAIRPNNFSYEGLGILFDYLEELGDSCGEEMELDVIAICCDFSEDHWRDIAANYDIDLSDCEDNEEKIEAVKDHLNDHGYGHCGITDDGAIIYQNY
jgi:predicted ArsR family transcriptional regulator